jgi:hypothetical protein
MSGLFIFLHVLPFVIAGCNALAVLTVEALHIKVPATPGILVQLPSISLVSVARVSITD